LPVDYYDLNVAGIPVHSTAFRAIHPDDLRVSPFRMFTSLLRLELIDNESLKEKARELLSTRQVFSAELLSLIDLSEKQGGLKSGLTNDQATRFIAQTLDVFRWHNKARVTKQEYETLKKSHALIADIVSFKGPHINHLTPRTLDIEEVQIQLSKRGKQGFISKQIIEGPPLRKHPILLRQTSFLAIEELIEFTDEKNGKHTARFGEIEQRGIALTPKGKRLYDRLLQQAKKAKAAKQSKYAEALTEAFIEFPDSHKELHAQELAYYSYSANPNLKVPINQISHEPLASPEQLVNDGILIISPIVYEDFLPVSAAGIFVSNLVDPVSINLENKNNKKIQHTQKQTHQALFEEALGATVIDSFSLYETQQQDSLKEAMKTVAFD